MFPFRFDYLIEEMKNKHDFYKKYDFDERVRDKLNNKFKASLEKDNWCYKKFEVKDSLDYNQISYFYDFVEDALFNTQEFKKNATSYYFEKDIKDDAKYIIKIKQKNYKGDIIFEKEYILDLKKISLKVFDTGIAILNYEVENSSYSKVKDILKINEFGRRVYPQFLRDNLDVEAPKNSFLADYIEVSGIIKVNETKDNFCDEIDYKNIDSMYTPKFITKILGNTFTTDKKDKDKFFIQPVLDDRMYVVSWYGNDKFSTRLQNINLYNFIEKEEKKETNKTDVCYFDKWYEYIFLDGNGKMVQNKYMQQDLIRKSTYFRWKDWGTLYGVTRYSFVCLTDRGYFGTNIILNHMKTMYLQMAILLLAQRASIVRFSDEITALSDIENKKDKRLSDKIANLYKNYLRFKNKLYFKEITPQEQGIELYDMAREVMRIDSDITDLSNEINSLNNYAFVLDEKEEREEMNKLTKLGTIFLPGTFLAGIFGMNVFKDGWIDNTIGLILAFLTIFCLTWFLTKKNNIDLLDFLLPQQFKKKKSLIIKSLYIIGLLAFWYIFYKLSTLDSIVKIILVIWVIICFYIIFINFLNNFEQNKA
jgi:hypothetical protein